MDRSDWETMQHSFNENKLLKDTFRKLEATNLFIK